MAAALTLLFTVCLLTGALCGQFQVFIPQTIEVLKGSCVTIPCSFDLEDQYIGNVDDTCRVVWRHNGVHVYDSSNPQKSKIKGHLSGDLLKKDCSTILDDMQPHFSGNYGFRVECQKRLTYSFPQHVEISVKDHPHRPALTPSKLKVKEGASVSLICSAPATCLSLPPRLVWTPRLGEAQEMLQENQDKTRVKISVLHFTASHLHDSQKISCTAVYSKQDDSYESSVNISLTAEITYSPKDITVSVSPSGPVQEDSNVTLTCSSRANPAVENYTWYRADEGQETLVGTGPALHIQALKESGPFFCLAENEVGAGRSRGKKIYIWGLGQCGPFNGVLSWAVVGASLAVNIILIVCMVCLWKQRKNGKPKKEESSYMNIDGICISRLQCHP